jgi:hypothetical protein
MPKEHDGGESVAAEGDGKRRRIDRHLRDERDAAGASRTVARIIAAAIATPAMPPHVATTRLSTSSWRTTGCGSRRARSARRARAWRAVPRASSSWRGSRTR